MGRTSCGTTGVPNLAFSFAELKKKSKTTHRRRKARHSCCSDSARLSRHGSADCTSRGCPFPTRCRSPIQTGQWRTRWAQARRLHDHELQVRLTFRECIRTILLGDVRVRGYLVDEVADLAKIVGRSVTWLTVRTRRGGIQLRSSSVPVMEEQVKETHVRLVTSL